MTTSPVVPDEIAKRLASWSRISIRLATAQYMIGIFGVACGATAAAAGGELGRYLAAASGVCTAILGFARPEQRYLRFISAWRVLDHAIMKFKLGRADIDELLAAVNTGETLLTEQLAKPARSDAP